MPGIKFLAFFYPPSQNPALTVSYGVHLEKEEAVSKKLLSILIILAIFSPDVSLAEAGVRPLSLGGAFVGLADDAEATFWNPAALGFLNRLEIAYSSLLHNQDEVGYDHWFSLVNPLPYIHDIDWGVFGISFMDDVAKGVVKYNSGLSLDSKLISRGYVISYGRKFLIENLALGANIRYATYDSKLNLPAIINGITYPNGSSDSDNGFGCDLAGYFRWSKLSFGILLQNVNEPKINLYGKDIEYELNIRPGLAYSRDEKTKYTIEVYGLTDSNQVRIGGERWIKPYLALRLGAYNLNKKEERAITFGCGLNSTEIFAYTDIEIDYALLYWTDNPAEEDDFSHLLGVKVRF